jgi:hypothetical protein
MALSRSLYIDDRDPGIVYSSDPGWKPYNGKATEFMQTTSNANQTGASAQIIFAGMFLLHLGLSPYNKYLKGI